MLNHFQEMNYGTARYTVLKELDTVGYIGRIVINMSPQFSTIMMQIGEFIDTYDNNDEALNLECMPHNPLLDNFNEILNVNTMFASLVLMNSELDWNTFLSAYIQFLQVAIGLSNHIVDQYDRSPESHEDIDNMRQQLDHIDHSLDPVMQLLQIGAGYTALLQASNQIVEELRGWRQSNPAAVRLSQAYLKAIGFEPEDAP